MFSVVLRKHKTISPGELWVVPQADAVVLQAGWSKLLRSEGLLTCLSKISDGLGQAAERVLAARGKHRSSEAWFPFQLSEGSGSSLPVFICAEHEWELEKGKERMAAF